MRQHGKQQAPQSAEETVRDIRRATRRQTDRLLQLIRVSVLAFPVRPKRGWETGADRDRIPAHAERRELQS